MLQPDCFVAIIWICVGLF